MTHPSQRERTDLFGNASVREVSYALGLSRGGIARRCLGPLLYLPAGRIARICVRADEAVAASGLSGGARSVLHDCSLRVSPRGAETIPPHGPVLVVSNHPGGLDSIAVLSSIPRRDLSVVISDSPFTRAFLTARSQFVFAPQDPAGRIGTLRASIARLRQGAALLLFPHGDVEPDPEIGTGAFESIGEWSRSVELMLRGAPETQLVVAIASGVLMPRLARSALVRIRRSAPRRQKLAQVLQFLLQVARPRSVRLDIHLSFAAPVAASDLPAAEPMPAVAAIARRLLAEHMATLPSGPRLDRPREPM